MSEVTTPELLTQLVNAHHDALVLYARQWGVSSAEDTVQDAIVRLMKQIQKSDQSDGWRPDNPVGWLYRVVRNEAVSRIRSEQRRRNREQTVAESTGSWFESNPDVRLDADHVTEKLRDLPLEQRETVVARIWGELSFDEIAELTETSSSTAHRRYLAGLAALREELE